MILIYIILIISVLILFKVFFLKKGEVKSSSSEKISEKASIYLKSGKKIEGYCLTISESKKFFIIKKDLDNPEEINNQIIIPLYSIDYIEIF